ncbi:hypothetical protein FRC08_002147 [Ceratobasidium sp. 394]|nr:hypothetical protein FRC08_002147 [Ceratobasidium sp. 394]
MKALALAHQAQQGKRRKVDSGGGPVQELVWKELLGLEGTIIVNHASRIQRSPLRKSDNIFDQTAISSPNNQLPNTRTEPKAFRFVIIPPSKYRASQRIDVQTRSDTTCAGHTGPARTTPVDTGRAGHVPIPEPIIGAPGSESADDMSMPDQSTHSHDASKALPRCEEARSARGEINSLPHPHNRQVLATRSMN